MATCASSVEVVSVVFTHNVMSSVYVVYFNLGISIRAPAKPHMTRLKSVGDKIAPCGTPITFWNILSCSCSEELVLIWKVRFSRKDLIMFRSRHGSRVRFAQCADDCFV